MNDHSVDRINLESPITEPTSLDPVLESIYRQQLEQRYASPLEANDGIGSDIACDADLEQSQRDEGEGYEFRLFTRPSALGPASLSRSNGPHRITLRSPSPTDGGLDLTCRGRPDKYYFTGDTSPELAKQYTQAAVSGQDIFEGLKRRWRGMELPWRVTVIKTTEPGKVVELGLQPQAQTNKRKRCGKKKRIVVRQRLEARAAKEMVARKNQAEKEVAEREKRTRRNREKKVKKKRKEKLKKTVDVQDPV